MEFLKKHFEKLILSVVLLGLAAVAATLPMKVNAEKEKEDLRKQSLIGAAAKPLAPVDLSTNQTVLTKVKSPIKFDIAGRHNLFNPVPWVQRPNGEVIKVQTGNEIGIGALEVTGINELRMVVSLEDVIPTQGAEGKTEYKYQITVIREGASSGGKQSRAMSPGQTAGGVGTLKEVQGPPENPTGLVVVLPDSSRTQIVISRDKPFQKVIGYSADLLYPPTNMAKKGVKQNDPILLGTEVYTVSNVEKDTVVFRAKANQKQVVKTIK